MEDVIREMKLKIKKDVLLVKRAEELKKLANISSFKALEFMMNVEKVLPNNMSGYVCGEVWYINYKGNRLFTFEKTKKYIGRGEKFNKYAKFGIIVISLNSQVALQRFVDYIIKEENIYCSYLFENWIDTEKSIYKKKWR